MQETSLELKFRLGRIPVVVEPWFWLMALVLGSNHRTLSGILVWVGVVFVSVLVHELGHALTARAFGASASIRLYSFGGLTYPDRRLSRGRRILLSLAGPGAGFVLGGLCVFASFQHLPLTDLGALALRDLVWANIGWGVFNLLPVPPLDGGHVLLDTLGPRRERLARILGGGLAAAITLWAIANQQLYLALLFGMLAWDNLQRTRR